MGWWKIASVGTGQISCQLPSGHTGSGPRNAVSGRDTPDDLYNGDEPADIMGDALKRIDSAFSRYWGRSAKADELRVAIHEYGSGFSIDNFIVELYLATPHAFYPTANCNPLVITGGLFVPQT